MRLLNKPNVQAPAFISWVPCEPEIVKLEIRGKYFLYDPNSMMLWDAEKQIFDAIEPSSIGTREKPFCRPDIREIPAKTLVLQTTYACNLKCRYCFVRHHYTTAENKLSFEDAMRAIRLLQPYGVGQKFDVSFFGGEPLLNWELIYRVSQEVIGMAKQQKKDWHFHITTNGTRITDEIAEYCAHNKFTFIVSLDGPENFHDNNRPYHKGTGSWADTMRGLDFLAAAFGKAGAKELPITLRGTFDKAGIDMTASLRFLNKLMYDSKASHVSVEPSSLGEGCAKDQMRLEDLEKEELEAIFQDEYWKAADWFLGELRQDRKPSFHHFEMQLQRLYDRIPAFSECGAGKGYVSVGPGGKISACHRENEATIGTLKTGIDPTRQAKWLDNRYHVRDTCPECWQRNICGGGCRHDSLQYGTPIATPDPVECLFKKMYVLPAIWLLSEMTEEQKQLYSRTKTNMQPRDQQSPPPQQIQPQTQGNFQKMQQPGWLPRSPGQLQFCDDPNCSCKNPKRQKEQHVPPPAQKEQPEGK